MVIPKVNSSKLKQAIEKFGSLEKAVEALQDEKLALENETLALQKQNGELRREKANLNTTRDKLFAEVTSLREECRKERSDLQLFLDDGMQRSCQYILLEAFLAMAADSPSATKPRETWLISLRKLLDSGWYSSGTPETLRSYFVRTTMGDFLKCFRCCSCGTQFIVNRKPDQYTHKHYECPVCHKSEVRADDSFLKAMVSEEQMENVRRAQQVQNENDQLKPFQVFFSVPCEICGQPITEWIEQNIKAGIKGYGWGHPACWNTTKGIAIMIAEVIKRSRRPKR